MDVQVERTFVIPPPPSEPEKVQFTVFDLLAPSYHYTALYAFTPPNPTNDALIAGLTAVLPLFPLLTARLDHNPATDRPFFVTGKGGAGDRKKLLKLYIFSIFLKNKQRPQC
ncbi:hypothetical protein PR202_gb08528 [Eleusine coracana subsp. coracana]|uniref:Uncharacterized protein n=1 Tax=Eleusine coracana subsp. coracana TaxID=191504 RepID=A0AAV5EEK3_ELECO|nr:hypothetical protein QOZ80_2BG0186370 [Eleusine coracana subsp. coracana]GJN21080.1 hypothetical protein PR202_gb08528 [Eleusine coracana subsp. coracana]